MTKRVPHAHIRGEGMQWGVTTKREKLKKVQKSPFSKKKKMRREKKFSRKEDDIFFTPPTHLIMMASFKKEREIKK